MVSLPKLRLSSSTNAFVKLTSVDLTGLATKLTFNVSRTFTTSHIHSSSPTQGSVHYVCATTRFCNCSWFYLFYLKTKLKGECCSSLSEYLEREAGETEVRKGWEALLRAGACPSLD